MGRVLEDRYRIDEPLGEGGMAWVFRAFHLGLQQPVAVKLLRPELRAEPLVVDRFLAEAQLTARLCGPHVVRVLDTGSVGDPCCPFIVMELLNGRDLEQVLADCVCLPAEQAVELLLQACSALAEAHASGIIHRDIKPANLFWTEVGEGMSFLKVLDFGVCKHRARREQRTSPGGCVGSPHYMAPEQVVEPGQVDERADIWALGVVLFEMLSGTLPFAGGSPQEVCASVLRDDVVSLRDASRSVPLPLSRVVARCLRKDPSERYRSVRELAEALQVALWSVQADGMAQTPRKAAVLTPAPRVNGASSSEGKPHVAESSTALPLPAASSPVLSSAAALPAASSSAVLSSAAALPPTGVPGAPAISSTEASAALSKVNGASGFRSWLGTSPTQPGGAGASIESAANARRRASGAPPIGARAAFALAATAGGLVAMVTLVTHLSSAPQPHLGAALPFDLNTAPSGSTPDELWQAGRESAELEETGLEQQGLEQQGQPPGLDRTEPARTGAERRAQATPPSADRATEPAAATATVAPPVGAERTKQAEKASREVDSLARITTPHHEAPPEALDQLLTPWVAP